MKKITKDHLRRLHGSIKSAYDKSIDRLDGLSPRERSALKLADSKMQSREYEGALKIYLSMPEAYIQRRLLHSIASAYWGLGETQYVTQYLLRVPERHRGTKTYELLASAYESTARHDRASAALEAAASHRLFTSLSNYEKANIHYRLFVNLQKNGNIPRAKKYLKEITNYIYKEDVAEFGEGILHYKMKNWLAGVSLLEDAARVHKGNARFLSVVARCCMYAGQLEKAKLYYENSLALDYTHADRHIELAECLQALGEIDKALSHYREAVARADAQPIDYAIKLADAYDATGRYIEAKKVLHDGIVFARPYAMSEDAYEEYASNKYNWYATYYESLDIEGNTIFYESMSGDKMADNPLALFELLLKDKRFKLFKHVWSVRTIDSVPKEYLSNPNIVFVKRGSRLYMKYLATAKYLICNSKFPGYFIRKPAQQYLNTWHGTAYKKLGTHTSKTLVGEGFTARNFLQASHILTPNEHMTNVQQDAYQIKGIYEGQIAETGYPRIDMTLNTTSKMKDKLRKDLGIIPDKPVVLYAPTWRPGNRFDTVRLERDLQNLSAQDCNIVFMGHHIMQRLIKKIEGLEGVIFTDSLMNSNRLLSLADVLVTDYSSIFYDFMVTGKPIVHYLYDLNKYSGKRGLYFGTDKLPGEIAYNSSELVNMVIRVIDRDYRNLENYEKMKKEFCPHEDGNVTKRVVDWFFFGEEKNIKIVKSEVKRKKRLFLLGDVSRLKDIDKKLLEKLENKVESSNYVLSRSASNLYPERIKIAEQLLAHATMLGYVSNNGSTAHEVIHRDIIGIATRDYRRCFGDTRFDEIVNLDSKSEYWRAFAESKHQLT